MVKIFSDGADLESIKAIYPLVDGFTTNPALMRKAGVKEYKNFAHSILSWVKDKPVSFEVFSDNEEGMIREAMTLSSFAENVYVKIPITFTSGESTKNVVGVLSDLNIKLNITAIMTVEQVREIIPYLKDGDFVSVFAGRIADTGVDPISIMDKVLFVLPEGMELIWASPREVFNIYQAERLGCHIITCAPDLIRKYHALKGKDLIEYSKETVLQFYNDAKESELTL